MFRQNLRSRHFQDFLLVTTFIYEMDSCVFQCDIPHQWIAQDRSALCLYTVRGWEVISCVCSMTFFLSAHWLKYNCYKKGLSRNDLNMLKSDFKHQTNQEQ